MKKLILCCLIFIFTHANAENCSKERLEALDKRLNQFFEKYKAKRIKARVIHYNCYVPLPDAKPFEDNVALVIPEVVKGLPFYDGKLNCRYWQHQHEGHIRCEVKKPLP